MKAPWEWALSVSIITVSWPIAECVGTCVINTCWLHGTELNCLLAFLFRIGCWKEPGIGTWQSNRANNLCSIINKDVVMLPKSFRSESELASNMRGSHIKQKFWESSSVWTKCSSSTFVSNEPAESENTCFIHRHSFDNTDVYHSLSFSHISYTWQSYEFILYTVTYTTYNS